MPSGAKKRKAAKKKQGNQSNNHSNPSSASTHSHGGYEDVKHHDEKDSDVGEVSSPGSQDHHNQHNPSTEGEEFKIEGKRDGKNGRVELDDSTRKSYDGGSSRSSSSSGSSSDDENHDIKNSQATKDISSVVDSKVEDISAADSEKISLLGEQVKVDMSSPVASSVVESLHEENGEKKLSSVEDKVGTSATLVDAALEREKGAIVQSIENTGNVLDQKVCVSQENDDRLTLPSNAPRATADNEAENEKDSAVTQPLLVPSPRPEQKTSWKSCCGLFEVFSGSAR